MAAVILKVNPLKAISSLVKLIHLRQSSPVNPLKAVLCGLSTPVVAAAVVSLSLHPGP